MQQLDTRSALPNRVVKLLCQFQDFIANGRKPCWGKLADGSLDLLRHAL